MIFHSSRFLFKGMIFFMLMFKFKTNESTYPFNYSMLCWWNKWCYTFRPYPSVSKNTLPLFENVLWISLFKLDHQFTFKSEALSFLKALCHSDGFTEGSFFITLERIILQHYRKKKKTDAPHSNYLSKLI